MRFNLDNLCYICKALQKLQNFGTKRRLSLRLQERISEHEDTTKPVADPRGGGGGGAEGTVPP